MNNPVDYLVAGVLKAVPKMGSGARPRTPAELNELFSKTFGFLIPDERLQKLLKRLEQHKYIDLTTDKYAGTSLRIIFDMPKISSRGMIENHKNGKNEILKRADSHDHAWLKSVYDKNDYWDDFDAMELEEELKDQSSAEIPASDRIVKLTDNQSQELVLKTDQIIAEFEQKTNSIDGDVDLRSRLLGQLKAAKELFLAGVVRFELIKLTILEALTILSEKYKDQVLGGLATALIIELIKLGF